MKVNCKCESNRLKKFEWHKWYAWYPIRLKDTIYWFEYLWRKKECYYGAAWGFCEYHYSENKPE